MDALETVGLPAIIRPAFTLGGTGGGVAYNVEEYEEICRSGLAPRPMRQILIDESLLGWKEYEMEVVRDKADNASSSARSRTSTRWASTQATRSPSPLP
jgi:carbamoyl-phosphate synthase large subunit